METFAVSDAMGIAESVAVSGTSEEASRPMLALAAMVALAGLDLVGAILARRYADQRSWVTLIGGVAIFGLLFWIYGRSLAYSELATVTFGWVIIVQVGVVVLDRVNSGVTIPTGKGLAMVAMVGLQCYLLFAPAAEASGS
jgi:hypothetical protein